MQVQIGQRQGMQTIKTLQRQATPVGRIRLGTSETRTSRKGDPYQKPVKLTSFRFTSPDRALIESIAQVYGGQVKPWTPQNSKGQQWEVITDQTTIIVMIPPVADVLSQWYEQWAAGRCTVRCDGVRDVIEMRPCVCAPEGQDVGKRACKPTTRVSMMLFNPKSGEMLSFGVFVLETHGYYAATRLPGQVEIMQATGARFARLSLVEQSKVILQEGKNVTTTWVEPRLDPIVGTAEQLAGTAAPLAIEAGSVQPERPALPRHDDDNTVDAVEVDAVDLGDEHRSNTRQDRAASEPEAPADFDIRSKPLPQHYLDAIARAQTDGKLREIFQELTGNAERAGIDMKAGPWAPVMPALLARKDELGRAGQSEAVPAQTVRRDTDEVETLWTQCYAQAGKRGILTDDLLAEFRKFSNGKTPETGTADDFRRFLAHIS